MYFHLTKLLLRLKICINGKFVYFILFALVHDTITVLFFGQHSQSFIFGILFIIRLYVHLGKMSEDRQDRDGSHFATPDHVRSGDRDQLNRGSRDRDNSRPATPDRGLSGDRDRSYCASRNRDKQWS